MPRRHPVLVPCFLLLALVLSVGAPCAGASVISTEAYIQPTDTQVWARYVRFRPGDEAVVALDPPRFSWPYVPGVLEAGQDFRADNLYTFQIARDAEFQQIVFEIADTPFNFYNFVPALGGPGPWYWRIGYDVGLANESWSQTMSFTVAPDATVWDRSSFAQKLAGPAVAHPRILFDDVVLRRPGSPGKVLDVPAILSNQIIKLADKVLNATWYKSFPAEDCPDFDPLDEAPRLECKLNYLSVAQGLTVVQLAWMLTGEAAYDGFAERFLTLASFPAGGLSSPEGLNPLLVDYKLPTHITEHLGYFYDWSYDSLTSEERSTVRDSLEWRIDHIVNDFVWARQKDGHACIIPGTLPLLGWSHEYEALFPTVIGALAIYDESELAAWTLEMGLHYIVGVTSAFGDDEGWNEGAGYGADKLNYLLDATVALDSAFPELDLFRNPMYGAYAEFLTHVSPLGARHTSFGNRGYHEGDWTETRMQAFRRLGVALGSSDVISNWWETGRWRRSQGSKVSLQPLWSNLSLSMANPEPAPVIPQAKRRLFAEAGWVAASSAPPGDRLAQQEAVGMVFHARPRGAYSHAFGSDNAFDIHAYGETVANGGGTTDNLLFFPRHSMSHNTVLVDGQGQLWTSISDYTEGNERGRTLDIAAPVRARIVAYEEGADWVYWAGDATSAYPQEVGLDRFVRHVVFVDDEYFVIFDDLAVTQGNTSQFQWLYHFGPATDNPVTFHAESFAFEYSVGDVDVWVQHVAGIDTLEFHDYPLEAGQVNVFTCGENPEPDTCREDFRNETFGIPGYEQDWHSTVVDAHHIWVMTTVPSTARNFLSVIVPRTSTDEAPVVQRISDRAVEITFRGRTRSISFDPASPADITVEAAMLADRARAEAP